MNMNKLIELQKEYIKLLEKALSETHVIAVGGNYKFDEYDIKKGELLRAEIDKRIEEIKQ